MNDAVIPGGMSLDDVGQILDVALTGESQAEDLRAHFMSDEFLEALVVSITANPATKKLRDLTVEYAERRGGLILSFLNLHHGGFWGRPFILTIDQCARVLSVDPSVLEQLYTEMMDEIRPTYIASQEYQAFLASEYWH